MHVVGRSPIVVLANRLASREEVRGFGRRLLVVRARLELGVPDDVSEVATELIALRPAVVVGSPDAAESAGRSERSGRRHARLLRRSAVAGVIQSPREVRRSQRELILMTGNLEGSGALRPV